MRLAWNITNHMGHLFFGGFARMTKGGFWRVWIDGIDSPADMCCKEARAAKEMDEFIAVGIDACHDEALYLNAEREGRADDFEATLDFEEINSKLAEYNRATSFNLKAALEARAAGASWDEAKEAGWAHVAEENEGREPSLEMLNDHHRY
jgi:hypothetical protein